MTKNELTALVKNVLSSLTDLFKKLQDQVNSLDTKVDANKASVDNVANQINSFKCYGTISTTTGSTADIQLDALTGNYRQTYIVVGNMNGVTAFYVLCWHSTGPGNTYGGRSDGASLKFSYGENGILHIANIPIWSHLTIYKVD